MEIVGLDLKEDVIDACSALAARSGAEGLRFEQGDIAGFDAREKVDLVVSLHACDTATDEALAQAIRWQADVILAVPVLPEGGLPADPERAARRRSSRHGLAKERLRGTRH